MEHPEVIGDPISQLGLRRIGNLEPIEGSGVFDRGDWMLQNSNGEVLNLDIGKGRLEDGSEVWMMYDISDRKRIEYDLDPGARAVPLVGAEFTERNPDSGGRFDTLRQSCGGVPVQGGCSMSSRGAVRIDVPRGAPQAHPAQCGEARQGRDVEEWEVELPGNGKRITFKWRLTIFDGQPAVQVSVSDVTDRHSSCRSGFARRWRKRPTSN